MRSRRGLGLRATVALAVVGLAPLSTATTSSSAASTATEGNDISFPQCGSAYPSSGAFGIVGINDGVPDTLNPCLGTSSSDPGYSESELYWAVSTSTGGSAQPKASLYVNTSDPGDVINGTPVSDWPTSGSTPYGACTTTTVASSTGAATVGQDSPACAWQFGDQESAKDASWLRLVAQAIDAQSPPTSVPSAPSAYPWWLDVETANTWQQGASGQALNLAALQGFVVGLRDAGAPSVGVYSTTYQWTLITGGTSPSTTTLGGLPTWIPGASDQAGAQAVCGAGSFTAGTVALAQFPNGEFDGDLACGGSTVPRATDTRIYGQTADATAAAEFTRAFPYAKESCPTSRAAVLATTAVYQDALSSQFLAEDLTTGTLLTPITSLSEVTATTLRKEGITTVFVVGGPLAITTTVVSALESLTAYECGGVSRSQTTGKLVVHRISGETQYATAMTVAEFVGTAGTESFAGAYATQNPTGGTGRYNDTAGKGSPAPPAAPEPTAILASGEEFQDAQAASVVSYRTKLPMLLTPATTLSTTAASAIVKLGVKQVILMGGPLAVTNTVEAALVERTGVSVLRVAGKDDTDTARELAGFEAARAADGLGWTPGHRVMVARGDGFTDGLCGAVLENVHHTTTGAAATARPLLLTETPTSIGTYLTTFFTVTGHTGIDRTKGKTVTSLTVLGGPLAVSAASISTMETDLSH